MLLIKKKTQLSTIALILLLTLPVMITLAPAQAIDIPTFLFVTASPDPVGLAKTFMSASLSANPHQQARVTQAISMKT